jgi:hypothetical protein
MFPVCCWKKDGYKLWLIGIFIVFLFHWKWALFLVIGYAAYLLGLGLIRWLIDLQTKTEQDDFL